MSFQEQLDYAIEEWNSGDVDDEWLFQKIREDHVGRLTAQEAFEEIKQTVTKLQNQLDETTATEIVETLIALGLRSGTTELPKSIISAKENLVRQFSTFDEYAKGKLGELFRYYRI